MLRPATDADLDRILRWRNHPQVRAVSNTQHEITADEHAAWWCRVQDDPNTQVLIYTRDGIESGVVSFFGLYDRSGWWGYYLDNDGLDARGALFPAWIQIQREAVRYAHNVLGLTTLDAETLSVNEAALAFNERMGFEVVEVNESVFSGKTVSVVHSRKTWSDDADR